MYLTETSEPTRGRPTETYLETVLLHKSPLVSGCTVTACVSWKRTVYMYLVCVFIKRLFTFFATPWSAIGICPSRGQLSRALGPALASARTQLPLYSYMFSLVSTQVKEFSMNLIS
jgi:hypothetical protein